MSGSIRRLNASAIPGTRISTWFKIPTWIHSHCRVAMRNLHTSNIPRSILAFPIATVLLVSQLKANSFFSWALDARTTSKPNDSNCWLLPLWSPVNNTSLNHNHFNCDIKAGIRSSKTPATVNVPLRSSKIVFNSISQLFVLYIITQDIVI